MNVFILIFILSRISLGISQDPPIWGMDIRFGKEEGLNFKFIPYVYYTKTYVDSCKYIYEGNYHYKRVYEFSFLRPNLLYGIEGRMEYLSENKNGIQPYLGFGIVYYEKRRWHTKCEIEDSVFTCFPYRTKNYYTGIVPLIGCEIYPALLFSNVLKIEKEKSKIISFNFEFNIYYKFLSSEEEENLGIGSGAGIRINF